MSLNLSSALFEFSLLRRTNWTPLDYVPYDDQSVYLVLDDFRPRRRRLGEADVEGRFGRSSICSKAIMETPCAWSASSLSKNVLDTFRRMSPGNPPAL
jgi:hypothetical protein